MKALFIVIGIIAVIIIGFVVYRFFAFRRESTKHSEEIMGPLLPLLAKLEANEDIPQDLVNELASSALTRWELYNLLNNFNKTDQFPKEYLNFEKAAESNLIQWLRFPTELDKIPSEIKFLEKVTIDELDYYVFKFCTDEPHWAAKDGWMLGVAGAYLGNSNPYEPVGSPFSRLSKVDSVSVLDEVNWVHKNITNYETK